MYTSLKKAGLTVMCNRLSQIFTIAICLFASSQSFGQAANIDQIRNGPADDPQKWFFSTFPNPSWVNGNAGASTAHYQEGHSIGYRSLLTGLTVGQQYEYTLEYDTRQSSKQAIDYLTYYQRLEPHSQFSHNAEVINPKIFILNGKEYQMGLVTISGTTNPNTYAIPAPGVVGTPVPTPSPGQPLKSFNDLPAAEKVMTIYNGTISSIVYANEGSLANKDASSSIRIRFLAAKDSVVLAWGGHIASRLDWGFVGNPPVPRSAGGISGSSYHMRHLSMRTYPGLSNIPLGNQDRSLAAAAVVPPPSCPTVASKTICAGSSSFSFSIASPDAGTTYTWSLSSNTASAAFSGGTNTGTSVTIVKSGGGNFTSGSFTLSISAVKNGITISCPSVATGTVEVTAVNATASPTTIDITASNHSTTLTANIDASSTDANNANYTYAWTKLQGAGTLSSASSRIASYEAATADATLEVIFKVVATQIDDNDANTAECSAEDTVHVNVGGFGNCDISNAGPFCQGTTNTHTGSPNPIPANATYAWTIEGYGGSGSTTSTIPGATNGVSVDVLAGSDYRIKLTQTYSNTALNTSCVKDVRVTATPSVAATYVGPACNETTFKVNVTSPTIGFTYDISQPGNSIDYTAITPSAGSPTVQFTNLVQGDGWTVTVKTSQASGACTASTSCDGNSLVENPAKLDPTAATKVPELNKKNDLNKVSDNVTDTYTITLPSNTKVKPLPNPYTDKVRFNLVSGISGIATLEIHNVLGQKIAVVYQGYIQAGKELTKEYYVPSRDRGTLIYTFRVGDQKISGKLVPVR
jgi:hypothetical protein